MLLHPPFSQMFSSAPCSQTRSIYVTVDMAVTETDNTFSHNTQNCHILFHMNLWISGLQKFVFDKYFTLLSCDMMNVTSSNISPSACVLDFT